MPPLLVEKTRTLFFSTDPVERVSVSLRSELILVLGCAIPGLFREEIACPHPSHHTDIIDIVLEIAVVSYFVERLGQEFVSLTC